MIRVTYTNGNDNNNNSLFISPEPFKQNSRGRRWQRRQNNDTIITEAKTHVNMWHKADICTVLLSSET